MEYSFLLSDRAENDLSQHLRKHGIIKYSAEINMI